MRIDYCCDACMSALEERKVLDAANKTLLAGVELSILEANRQSTLEDALDSLAPSLVSVQAGQQIISCTGESCPFSASERAWSTISKCPVCDTPKP